MSALQDATGHALSGTTPAAIDLYEQAAHELRCLNADPLATIDRALQVAPEMAMAHVLRAWLHLLGTEPAALPEARACAKAAARACRHRPRAPACAGRGAGGRRPLARRRPRAGGRRRAPSARRAGAAGRPPDRLLHRRLAHAARPHRPRAAAWEPGHAGLSRGARHARLRARGDGRLRARRAHRPARDRARAARRLGAACGGPCAWRCRTRQRDGIAWMRAECGRLGAGQLLCRAQLVAPGAVPPRARPRSTRCWRCSTRSIGGTGSVVVLDMVDAERAAVAAAAARRRCRRRAGRRWPIAGRRSPTPATTRSTTCTR